MIIKLGGLMLTGCESHDLWVKQARSHTGSKLKRAQWVHHPGERYVIIWSPRKFWGGRQRLLVIRRRGRMYQIKRHSPMCSSGSKVYGCPCVYKATQTVITTVLRFLWIADSVQEYHPLVSWIVSPKTSRLGNIAEYAIIFNCQVWSKQRFR